MRRCQNEIRDYFQALRLIKLISQSKISKSVKLKSIIDPIVYDWSLHVVKVKEPEMD